MKKVSMVVHSSLQQELADCLRSLQLESFMFAHIEEHGSQSSNDAPLTARDRVVGYVPKVRVDVIVDDPQILLDAVRQSAMSFKGKGIFWVTEIDAMGEL